MDARSLIARVLDRAASLGLRPWERLALILALALLSVLGEEALRVVARVALEPADDPDHRDRDPSVLTDSNGTPLQPRKDDDGGQA